MSFNLKMIRCIIKLKSFREACGRFLMPSIEAGLLCRAEKSFQDRIGRAPMGEQHTRQRRQRLAFGVSGLVAGLVAFGPSPVFADDLLDKTRVDDSLQTAAVDPDFENVEAQDGDPAEEMTDRVILIQAALVSRGCYAGSINGVWDKRTQAAAANAARADGLDIAAKDPTSDLVEAFLGSDGKDCASNVRSPTEVTARNMWIIAPGEEARDANGVVVPMPQSKPEGEGRSRIRTAARTTTDAEPPVTPEARAAARATLRKYKARRNYEKRQRNRSGIKRRSSKKSYSRSRGRKKVVKRSRAPAAFVRPVGVGRF